MIRVGIVGTGRVAVDRHLPDIRTAGGEVVALADTVPGRAARFAQQLQVPHAYEDYRELLRQTDVDVVAICTPPASHEEIAVSAFRAGRHVYLEKPPAMNELEMKRITQASDASGKLLLSGSNSIYSQEIQFLKSLIDSGRFGTIYHAECQKIISIAHAEGWHARKAVAGGGVGMNSVPHRLDWILFLLDTPRVVSVTATIYDHFVHKPAPDRTHAGYQLMDVAEGISQGDEPADVEDSLVAMIRFDNGCTLLVRDFAGANMKDEALVKLYGTKGGVILDHARLGKEKEGITLFGQTVNGQILETNPILPQSTDGSHVSAYRHLFDCIQNGRPSTSSPGSRGIVIMKIMDALYKSAVEGGRQIFCE